MLLSYLGEKGIQLFSKLWKIMNPMFHLFVQFLKLKIFYLALKLRSRLLIHHSHHAFCNSKMNVLLLKAFTFRKGIRFLPLHLFLRLEMRKLILLRNLLFKMPTSCILFHQGSNQLEPHLGTCPNLHILLLLSSLRILKKTHHLHWS